MWLDKNKAYYGTYGCLHAAYLLVTVNLLHLIQAL